MAFDSLKQDLKVLMTDNILISKGDFVFEEVKIHEEYKSIFKVKKTVSKKDVEEWINDYRELFPAGINASGYPFRGSKASCVDKMIKFLNTNDYEKDIILQATKEYVAIKKRDSYQYMQLADNFISKNNVSTLLSFCELMTEDFKPTINVENKFDI